MCLNGVKAQEGAVPGWGRRGGAWGLRGGGAQGCVWRERPGMGRWGGVTEDAGPDRSRGPRRAAGARLPGPEHSAGAERGRPGVGKSLRRGEKVARLPPGWLCRAEPPGPGQVRGHRQVRAAAGGAAAERDAGGPGRLLPVPPGRVVVAGRAGAAGSALGRGAGKSSSAAALCIQKARPRWDGALGGVGVTDGCPVCGNNRFGGY